MATNPWLIDEAMRLETLASYDILDTPTEDAFDDIALRASQACGTQAALISLIDKNRQWFKARIGLAERETPLAQSVCVHALSQPGLLVIPDLTADPRTSANTLVAGPPHIRFYAGARLEASDGTAIGTLCVVDTATRPEGLSVEQEALLKDLAKETMVLMEARRSRPQLKGLT